MKSINKIIKNDKNILKNNNIKNKIKNQFNQSNPKLQFLLLCYERKWWPKLNIF